MDSRRQFHNIEDKDSENPSISIMQWNILADSLCDSKAFPLVPIDQLSYSNRHSKMISYIKEMSPDILCLEECDHPNQFVADLKDIYSDHIFLKKTNSYGNDGNLLLYKSKFQLLNMEKESYISSECWQPFENTNYTLENYNDWVNSMKPASQCFVYAKFQENDSQRKFSVLMTHLKAKKPFEAVRCQQVKQICQFLKFKNCSDNCFVLGDFNADREEDAITVMRKNQFKGVFDWYEEDPENYKKLFTSFKYHVAGKKELRVIDYIWYSDKSARLQKVLMPPALDTISNDKGMPDLHNPSDHLPLYAEFALLNTSSSPNSKLVTTENIANHDPSVKNVYIIKRLWDSPDTITCLKQV